MRFDLVCNLLPKVIAASLRSLSSECRLQWPGAVKQTNYFFYFSSQLIFLVHVPTKPVSLSIIDSRIMVEPVSVGFSKAMASVDSAGQKSTSPTVSIYVYVVLE